ncbi:hypothetical protein QTP88_015556 [Uroleucon formosanum]
MSCMAIRNKVTLRTDPWGRPFSVGYKLDKLCLLSVLMREIGLQLDMLNLFLLGLGIGMIIALPHGSGFLMKEYGISSGPGLLLLQFDLASNISEVLKGMFKKFKWQILGRNLSHCYFFGRLPRYLWIYPMVLRVKYCYVVEPRVNGGSVGINGAGIFLPYFCFALFGDKSGVSSGFFELNMVERGF